MLVAGSCGKHGSPIFESGTTACGDRECAVRCEICQAVVRPGLRFCSGLSPCWRAALGKGLIMSDDRHVVEQGRDGLCDHNYTYGSCPNAGCRFVIGCDARPRGDAVNHPSHYNTGKYEVIDVIEDWKLDFCLGNAVKYIARAGKKDPAKFVEDLRKAAFYLNYEITIISKLEGK